MLARSTFAGVVYLWAIPCSLSLLPQCDTCQRAAAPAKVPTLQDTDALGPLEKLQSAKSPPKLTQAVLAVSSSSVQASTLTR